MGNAAVTLLKNRNARKRNICVYLNCGDPGLEITRQLIEVCEHKKVDLIELGVPFANSFTDGSGVLRSHERALKNNVQLEHVLDMLAQLRKSCIIPVVLLADFSHTVKPRGLANFIQQIKNAGIDSVLLHGLPPLYFNDYVRLTNEHNIDPVFSLYPNSKPQVITQTLANARSFIYLVSQYGRTGNLIDFQSPELQKFYKKIRNATELPLMAGFGIKNRTDIETIFSTSELDGVIIGSAITNIIESELHGPHRIIAQVENYLDSITPTKSIGYNEQAFMEATSEYTA